MIVKLNGVTIAGAGREGTSEFRINGKLLTQSAAYLRGVEEDEFDRGNRSTIITFTSHKLLADEAEAVAFLLERGDSVLGRGLVTLLQVTPRRRIERYMKNAVVRGYNGRHIGVTVFCDYEIKGGKILTVRPT